MHPTEGAFIDLSRQLANVAAQVSLAYNQAQGQLGLESVLTPQRLSTQETTQASLQVLSQLRDLTDKHKELYSQFMEKASTAMQQEIAKMPAAQQDQYRVGIAVTLHDHLSAQLDFYRDREEWINIAVELCSFVDERRSTIQFEEGALLFETDAEIGQFNDLIARLDEIHHREVALLESRKACALRAAMYLGATN
jgi:hypothetical protein